MAHGSDRKFFSKQGGFSYEPIKQNGDEGDHGSYPVPNLQWFRTYRSLLCVSDYSGVLKCIS